MKILFIHPNMPGQFKHLARIYAQDPNNTVVFLTKPKDLEIPNVIKVEYKVDRDCLPDIHRYLIPFERAVIHAQEVWRVCKKMKESGFVPDVICGHLGWGDGLFLKDIYPNTPILAYAEFFYEGDGADMEFVNPGGVLDDDKARVRMKNALHLFNLTYSEWMITPTYFQRDRHPKDFWHRISVLHDGIDTDAVKPNPQATINLSNGVKLSAKDEVVTYISRNFEDYRGFPQFVKAVEMIHARRPNAQILMVGADGVSYGKMPKGIKNYRDHLLSQIKYDKNRLHFLGTLPYNDMLRVLQISQAHIYLTVPFVLSWSMLEALSSGCLVIGSNTEPVLEVLRHNENGLVVDFHTPSEIADAVDAIFAHPTRMQHLRDGARATVMNHFALNKTLPLQMRLINELAQGKAMPPVAEDIRAFYPDPQLEMQMKKKVAGV